MPLVPTAKTRKIALELLDAAKRGYPFTRIAMKHGISKQRCDQIINSVGLRSQVQGLLDSRLVVCPKCGVAKGKSRFTRSRRGYMKVTDGWCRSCRNAYRAAAIAPIKTPSEGDIAFAAGFFDGEGTTWNKTIGITQKDPEVLMSLRDLFGGIVCTQGKKAYQLYITGENAKAFARRILDVPLLSQRKRRQLSETVLAI